MPRQCPYEKAVQCDFMEKCEGCETYAEALVRNKDPRPEEQWAWWDSEKGGYSHVYSKELCVRLCFPDHAHEQEKAGKGKVVRVKIVPIEE